MNAPVAHSGGHFLEAHLRSTSRDATSFAARFRAASWGAAAGLWHDLGKYDPAFQAYLAGHGGDEDAHLESSPGIGSRGPEHSIAGALHAMARLGPGTGRVLAWCIAGHHAGLADWDSKESGRGSLKDRMASGEQRDMLGRARAGGAPAALLDAPPPTDGPRGLTPEGLAFFIRMLFSVLVDADFLDTEAHFDRDRPKARQGWPALADLLPVLDAHLDAKTEAALRGQPGPVNAARAEVLAACRAGAALPPGLFTLTVPTGGGKTLASLAFALRHAMRHGLRRVIYAIPYTSIIEQTADVFRGAFACLGEVVVEHHSNLVPARETNRTRLAAENWDAPLVVTTTVQLFESLFAAHPARCRKLHNIAGSVLILDEAQLLPVHFLHPILFALDELMAHYDVSVVLTTATQPALLRRDAFPIGLRMPCRELAPAPERLRTALRRVRIERLHGLARRADWPELAGLLATERRVLCVVDRRDAARDLLDLMPPGTFHLSALMCPQHRSDVLARIRAQLADPLAEVRVVATQLVEAGVDLDFPVVFRASAGLDSIAQAAGRCNREGHLREGRVVVFRAPLDPPRGVLQQAEAIARPILAKDTADPLTHAAFERFFGELYWAQGGHDAEQLLSGQHRLLASGNCEFKFRTASERFRLIPDVQVPVVVPYGEGVRLIEAAGRGQPTRQQWRALQRFSVGIYRRSLAELLRNQLVHEAMPGVFVLDAPLYDKIVGLDIRRPGLFTPEEMIV